MASSKVAPNLTGSYLDLESMRNDTLRMLVDCLDKSGGEGGSASGSGITLVLDVKLSGPLALLTSTSVLREHGVERIHLLGSDLPFSAQSHSQADPSSIRQQRIVYIIRAEPKNAVTIAEHVNAAQTPAFASCSFSFSACFVPRASVACVKLLEERGVLGEMNYLSHFSLGWVPLDDDVVSLHMDGVLQSVGVGNDMGDLYDVARAVFELQQRFGGNGKGNGANVGVDGSRSRDAGFAAMQIKAKGALAVEVARMMERMRMESCQNVSGEQSSAGLASLGSGEGKREGYGIAGNSSKEAGPAGGVSNQIDAIILLDRQVDFSTALATQHTYEGLIDELIGIRNGAVEESAAMPSSSSSSGGSASDSENGSGTVKKGKIAMNGSDALFREVRDLRFPEAATMLHQKNVDMNDAYKNVKVSSGTESVSDLKAFVKKLKEGALAALERHTNIAMRVDQATRERRFRDRIEIEQSILNGDDLDHCADYLETQMNRQEPIIDVLRLFCLLSVASGGIRPRAWDFLRKEFLQTYGYHHVITLNNLMKVGLIRKQDGPKSGFPNMRRPLRLVDTTGVSGAGSESSTETDISYIYSGYAPLSVRLVQMAVLNGFSPATDLLRQLPGDLVEVTQDYDDRGQPIQTPPKPIKSIIDRRPFVVVVFIGGITFAEISAMRYLSAKELVPVDFLIATTMVINGSTMLAPLVDDSVPDLAIDK